MSSNNKKEKKNRILKNKNEEDLKTIQHQRFDLDDELDNTFLVEVEEDENTSSYINRKSNSNKNNKDKTNKIKILTIFLFVIVIILIGIIIFHYMNFNHNKVEIVTKEKIVEVIDDNYLFLGDSITYRYDLEKYFPDMYVVNSGVEGNTTEDILKNMKERVYDYNPSKVFLLIGTNDLAESNGWSEDDIVNNIKKLIENIQNNRALTEIYIESILPVNHDISNSPSIDKDYNKIININKKLEKFCEENNLTYINLYDELIDEDGHLPPRYTDDGLHLNEEGYKVITKEIKNYLK